MSRYLIGTPCRTPNQGHRSVTSLLIIFARSERQILKGTSSPLRRREIQSAQARFQCYLHHDSCVIQSRHKTRRFDLPRRSEDHGLAQLSSLLCCSISRNNVLLTGPCSFFHTQAFLLGALAFHDNKIEDQRAEATLSCTGNHGEESSTSFALSFSPHNRNATTLHHFDDLCPPVLLPDGCSLSELARTTVLNVYSTNH